MEIIDLARQIGVAIQNNEKYIKFRTAEQVVESDSDLQNMIGEFNMLKMSINNEMSKSDSNNDKVSELNQKFKEVYEKIIKDEKMEKYNAAKKELDDILIRVNTIIMQSAQGEDPMTTDYHGYNEQCGGSCSTCGGCH